MKQEKLVKKVNLYLKRAKQSPSVENHPIDREGYWRIMGGTTSAHGLREPMKNVVQGKFIDAVAYAVQQSEFYSDRDRYTLDDPSNYFHGRVEKIKVRELKDQGLAKTIKNSK